MKIVVSSNCQTAGVASALRFFFPASVVRPIPLAAPGNASAINHILQELADADFWITSDTTGFAEQGFVQRAGLTTIRMPVIGFQAFHPDLCYARKISNGELTTLHYNSAIGVWAYSKGIDIDVAATLYNQNVYSDLGYFDYWTASKAHLQKLFANSDLTGDEFSRFFVAVQRKGSFMHSINHPKIEALVALARLLALRMGYLGKIWDIDVELPDALLDDLVWPVYPEVASSLGLEGHYTWKMRTTFLNGIHNYLQFTYDNYKKQEILSGDIEIIGSYQGWDLKKLDTVLSREVKN